ncbi:MAG: THUMP domain-containing protein [Promethearchaeati archaeon]
MRQITFHKSYNLILVRYSGEIWLKSMKVKMRMLKILIKNIQNMLEREKIPYTKYQITDDSARILFFFKHEFIKEAIKVISKAFGVHSLSAALRTSNRIQNISERAIEIGDLIFKQDDSFALRVKRSGKHNFSSQDVAEKVGKILLDNFSHLNLKVNLSNPNKIIYIEVRNQFSYLFTDIIETKWEGLPIEYKKKIGVMDIGRLSDLIAGFLLMRRGCVIYPVLFNISETEDLVDKRIANWEEIFNYTPFSKFSLIIINLLPILDFVEEELGQKEYLCSLCRLIRFEIIAKLSEDFQTKIKYIRGFSDGLNFNNLNSCNDEIDLDSISLNYLFSQHPIFTPLVGFDSERIKKDIKEISNNLNHIDYCKFKPTNQKFDSETVKKMYNSLKIKSLIRDAIDKSSQYIIK